MRDPFDGPEEWDLLPEWVQRERRAALHRLDSDERFRQRYWLVGVLVTLLGGAGVLAVTGDVARTLIVSLLGLPLIVFVMRFVAMMSRDLTAPPGSDVREVWERTRAGGRTLPPRQPRPRVLASKLVAQITLMVAAMAGGAVAAWHATGGSPVVTRRIAAFAGAAAGQALLSVLSATFRGFRGLRGIRRDRVS